MNNGKICVSVCAKTTDRFIKNFKSATEFADVIELRFDCLSENELEKFNGEIETILQSFGGKILAAFRPTEQGGKRELTVNERVKFWSNARLLKFIDWADFELDFPTELIKKPGKKTFDKIIKSFHDFKKSPADLIEIFNQTAKDADLLKIAVQIDDVADSLSIWRLLEKAKSENKQFVPIAMGEAGKWTRILGLAYGAPMTYASLDDGNQTASGQIPAQDLIETYRVKELDDKTEIYGIMGNPVSHSLSPFIHNAAFKFHALNAVYIPFEVKKLENFLTKFIRAKTREVGLNFKGFSVTIPHKETIIKRLDFIDETAKKIGAVNTIRIEDGKLSGFNTDAEGFAEPLKDIYGDLKEARVAVLGSGGAARACLYALKKENSNLTIFSRNREKAEILADEFKIKSFAFDHRNGNFSDFDILVNATPLGSEGEFKNETPLFAEQLKNVKLVYDLVYNPAETRFIKEARKANAATINGLAMLMAQAAKQFELWTKKTAPIAEMSAALSRKIKN